MGARELGTSAVNTWCKGCGNFAILNAVRTVLEAIGEERGGMENIVLVSGIGCHAKIVDYLNVNSFYAIHGRVAPVAEGIKLANQNLTVIGFAGDGDSYGEGLEHLVFAAKRNVDITMIIHNNRVYGLTTGQYTPTSPLGFKGKSTPRGTKEPPLNPLELMLASGASFIARGYSNRMDLLKQTLREAIAHRGFALVDVLQVCVTFYNLYMDYNKRVYQPEGHDAGGHEAAFHKIREWDYNSQAPIALGTLYRCERPLFEGPARSEEMTLPVRAARISSLLKERI
ncbi:MAG: thiamine pyrophosphate-dependent enzyme [Candidatus Aureabacteria bacterium]|nr:thiamine pyrophosphate-dependent enzyme [Candidatus Auribacterota bacterium]